MKKATRPKPFDPNKAAFSILQQVTDGTRIPFSEMSAALDNSALRRKLMREMSKIGGLKGGASGAGASNAKRRSEMAKIAAKARWGPRKGE
jgi:hypothetical protein